MCFNSTTTKPHYDRGTHKNTWWRHQMEKFSALLALCARNSPVTGEFPAQRPGTQSFDVLFDLCLYKRLSREAGDLRRHRAHYAIKRLTESSSGVTTKLHMSLHFFSFSYFCWFIINSCRSDDIIQNHWWDLMKSRGSFGQMRGII